MKYQMLAPNGAVIIERHTPFTAAERDIGYAHGAVFRTLSITALDSTVTALNCGTCIGDAHDVAVQQREKGLAKYGVSIEDAKMPLVDLVRHAQEEAADASVYTARLMQRIKAREEALTDALAKIGYTHVWNEDDNVVLRYVGGDK